MSFIHVRTIDDKNLWLNLERVGAFSYSPQEHICLIEIPGGEPHQISVDEFSKIEPILEAQQDKFKYKNKFRTGN